jgi:hypothetical protein
MEKLYVKTPENLLRCVEDNLIQVGSRELYFSLSLS